MKKLNELLKDSSKIKDEIVVAFKPKHEYHKFDDNDRIHIRIMAIIELAHNRELMEYILNHRIKEIIKYNPVDDMVYYKIRFIKERRTKYRGDC